MTTADQIARLLDHELDRIADHWLMAHEDKCSKATVLRIAAKYDAVERVAGQIADVWARNDFPECVEQLHLDRSAAERARRPMDGRS